MNSRIRTLVTAACALAGVFVFAAQLPDGYRQLEYIESDGASWIDTGVVPDQGTFCSVDVMSYNKVLQSRVVTARDCAYEGMTGYLYFEIYINGYGQWTGAYQDDVGNWGQCGVMPTAEVGKRVRIAIDAPQGHFIVDDQTGTFTFGGGKGHTHQGQRAIRFMAPSLGSGGAAQPAFVGRFYGATIAQNGVTVREFVPCRRESDGAVGLFDLAPNADADYTRFYGNAGTGTLSPSMGMDVANGKASVVFPAANAARTLYLAYGATDGGNVTNGWDHVIAAANVPANATSVADVALPAGFGTTYSCVRAFLAFADASREMYVCTTRDYVQDGLFAQWDGIENAGVCLRNDSAQGPAELKGSLAVTRNGTLSPVDAKSFAFGSGYLSFTSDAITNALKEGRMTVELVLAGNGNFNHNGGLVTFGKATRGLWIYQQHSDSYKGMISAVCYHATASGQFDYLGLSPFGTTGIHSYSFALGDSTANSFYAVNGARGGTVTRFSTDLTDNTCWLGCYQNGGTKAVAKVYSIRLYTRKLSQDEIAANAAIDTIRFKSAMLDSTATWPKNPEVLQANREGGRIASLDVAVPVSDKVRTLYAVWGPEDQGSGFDAWTNTVRLCDIPAGVGVTNGVAIPAAAKKALNRKGGFRLFLKRGASSYVQRGLYAQWDGIENAGFGVHDATAAKPIDLMGAVNTTLTGTMAAHEKYFNFGSGYLNFSSTALKDAINSGALTVEMVLEQNGNFTHNGGLVTLGNASRGLWIYQQKSDKYDGMISAFCYHAAASGEFDYLALSPQGTTGIHSYSFALGDSTENSFYAVNGVRGGKTLTRFSTDLNDGTCWLGSYQNGNFIAKAKVYSIRLYTAKLTEDEVAANAELDIERFRQNVSLASGFYPTLPAGLVIVIR